MVGVTVTRATAVLMSWNISNLDIRNFLEENKNKIEIELSKSVGRQSQAGWFVSGGATLLVRRSSIPRSQDCLF